MAHHSLDQQKQRAWDNQQHVYDALLGLCDTDAAKIYDDKSLKHAFAHTPSAIKCIDERVVTDQPAVGLAGSGVLLSAHERTVMAEKLRPLNLTTVIYHEGCGAAALFCHEHTKATGEHLDVMNEAKLAAEKMCHLLALPNAMKKAGHNPDSHLAMTGHPHFHHARAVIVDFSGQFNPTPLDFPAAFLLSAAYHPSLEYTFKELDIAISIAMGDHGFGQERFVDKPLAVVAVNEPDGDIFSPYKSRPELTLLTLNY